MNVPEGQELAQGRPVRVFGEHVEQLPRGTDDEGEYRWEVGDEGLVAAHDPREVRQDRHAPDDGPHQRSRLAGVR